MFWALVNIEIKMVFNLNFPRQNSEINPLQLDPGETLFVLGANGTGKSSLMFIFAQQNPGQTRKISAHRQTWMNTDALDMTPAAKIQTEQSIKTDDRRPYSRFRDQLAAQRASITIFELIDAENVRARAIARAFDAGDQESAGSVRNSVSFL